jgi:hypothetical protein
MILCLIPQGFIIFLIVVMKVRVIRSIKAFLLGLPRMDSFRSRCNFLAYRRTIFI